MTHRLIVLASCLLASSPLFAHPKTDVVHLKNGDRITCEIKNLQRGRLTVSTDAFGSVGIEWDDIARIQSNYVYQVELQSGIRYVGSLPPSEEDGAILVGDPRGSTRLDAARVVTAIPIEASFFDRLKSSVDAGYDFTQASSATSWSLNADATYTVEKFVAKADFASSIQAQEGAETTNRQNLSLSYTRHVGARWFWMALGQFETSENLDLDFRGLGGGGIGKRLVVSNHHLVGLLGGAVFSREKFADQADFDSNTEAVVALDAQTFQFDRPELDLSGRVAVFPSLSAFGRVRIQAKGTARIEIVKDLYWSLNVYDNYDSDPPSETDRRNDFGISTSLGFTF